MKKYLILCMIFLTMTAMLVVEHNRCQYIENERDIYALNTQTLLISVEHYKAKDSLSAARVGELQLELDQYKKLRASDYELIQSLAAKNRELQSVTSTQMQTIIQLQATLKDSVIIYNTDTIIAQCLDIIDPYFEMNGCVVNSKFAGNLLTKDSLLITETIEYKRLLGFLWKTSAIKNRQYDVVSRNPHTQINHIEVTTIR